MAEFCKQCADELGLPESDFVNMCREGEKICVLCEGCGPIYVDRDGVRIDEEKRATEEEQ